MIKLGLFDGSFAHQNSVSLGGENVNEKPQKVQWTRDIVQPVDIFTDMRLSDVNKIPSYKTRIGMLVEPRSLSETHYHAALRLRDDFDCILTFDKNITESETDFMYYPIGGSWIPTPNWGMKPKSEDVSIIASFKTGAVGHRLRHEIIGRYFQFSNMRHVFGTGYMRVDSKLTALEKYRFSIVVESCKMRGYFTEKIIDALSQGCIPIYWGAPDIGDFFDRRGILAFDTPEELEYILYEATTKGEELYHRLSPYANINYEHSWNYRCAEDWIAKNYSFMFEQCETQDDQ